MVTRCTFETKDSTNIMSHRINFSPAGNLAPVIWPPLPCTPLPPEFWQFLTTDGRLRFKCDDTRAETRFRLSTKRTSPFKSAGASVLSTTDSRVVRISGSNAGYTMFRGGVKGTGYPLHSPVSPSLPLPCVTVSHHISTGLYKGSPWVTATITTGAKMLSDFMVSAIFTYSKHRKHLNPVYTQLRILFATIRYNSIYIYTTASTNRWKIYHALLKDGFPFIVTPITAAVTGFIGVCRFSMR